MRHVISYALEVIMKTIYTWYQNLKFRQKIMILCFIVSFVPILILGLFSFVKTRELLISDEKVHLNNILEQANSSLDHYLTVYVNIINTLAWDETIQAATDTEYTSNYDMFIADREIFDSKFLMTQAMHKEIECITLYTETNLFPHSTTVDSISKIKKTPWYPSALVSAKPFFTYDSSQKSLLLICRLPFQSYTNIIVITLSYEDTFTNFKSLFEADYAIGIYDENDKLLFNHSALDYEQYPDHIFYHILKDTMENNKNQIFFQQSTKQNSFGWTILIYRPLREIKSSANSFIFVIVGMVLLCIIAISCIGILLSRQVVHPLEQLAENMDHIHADNLVVTIKSNSNDEIAHLIRTFEKMAQRLELTIDELYRNKLLKQEYRLQMLQSQINPHFLYNCLSMINSKAIRSNQPDISKITLLLSTFYRTTLNKGHNTITVQEEWRNIISYIEIQKMLHSSSFEVNCKIDESLYPYHIINLIIQPLVENAILHGIDYKENLDQEVGVVTILGQHDNGSMKFIVSDNGCGMGEETLKYITDTETNGYGIRNVDQRIKLFFGESYGVSYESELGVGTTATITLPLNL
jgi:two-component system sensor histidine kinase YesM